MNLLFGTCVGSWEKYNTYVAPQAVKHTAVCTRFDQATNISTVYNDILTVARDKLPIDVLVLLHDDLEIVDDDLREKIEKAFTDEDVVLIGVAGGRGVHGLTWWDHSPIGHQWLGDQLIDFTQREGEVDGLEGSIMILSRWAIENLTFDESFGGFYGYDCDLPQQVVRAGKKVKVVDIDTVHHSQLGFKTPALRLQFGETNSKFKAKWGFS